MTVSRQAGSRLSGCRAAGRRRASAVSSTALPTADSGPATPLTTPSVTPVTPLSFSAPPRAASSTPLTVSLTVSVDRAGGRAGAAAAATAGVAAAWSRREPEEPLPALDAPEPGASRRRRSPPGRPSRHWHAGFAAGAAAAVALPGRAPGRRRRRCRRAPRLAARRCRRPPPAVRARRGAGGAGDGGAPRRRGAPPRDGSGRQRPPAAAAEPGIGQSLEDLGRDEHDEGGDGDRDQRRARHRAHQIGVRLANHRGYLKVAHGVGDGAVYPNLEVDVRAEAVAGAAAVADHLRPGRPTGRR